jgi:hypothetical protein
MTGQYNQLHAQSLRVTLFFGDSGRCRCQLCRQLHLSCVFTCLVLLRLRCLGFGAMRLLGAGG